MDVQDKTLKQELQRYGYQLNINIRPYLLYVKVNRYSGYRELVLCTHLYYDDRWVGVFKTLTDECSGNRLGYIDKLNTAGMNNGLREVSMSVKMFMYLDESKIHQDFLDYRDHFKRKKIDCPSKEEVIKFFKNK